MKKYVVGMAMLMAAGSVFADNSHQQGSMALGFDTNTDNMVLGRYMLSNNLALVAGAGLQFAGGDADGTNVGVMGGVRYYLNPTDTSLFAGGHIGYDQSETTVDTPTLADPNATTTYTDTTFSLMADVGVEHFLSKQFSVEGTVSIGLAIADNDPNFTATYFGTSRAGVGFNFYF